MSYPLVKSAISDHNQTQLEYFSQAIKKTMIPVNSYYVNRHVDKLIAYSGITRDEKILEVGCGMGKFTLPLLKKGYTVCGIDLSPFLLQKLLEYNNNTHPVELICSDILEIPEQYNNKFDRVIGFFTLHHFLQMEIYFQAIKRVLKPGGTITFVEPNAYNPLYYIQIAITPSMSWEGDKGVAQMTPSRFARAAHYAQLENLIIHKYGFFPPFMVNTKLGKRCELLLERLKFLNNFSAFQVVHLTKTFC